MSNSIINKKVVGIVQARVNSTRLPRKVIKDLGGRSLIEFLIERLKCCKDLDEIFIATTTDKSDDCIEKIANKLKIGHLF